MQTYNHYSPIECDIFQPLYPPLPDSRIAKACVSTTTQASPSPTAPWTPFQAHCVHITDSYPGAILRTLISTLVHNRQMYNIYDGTGATIMGKHSIRWSNHRDLTTLYSPFSCLMRFRHPVKLFTLFWPPVYGGSKCNHCKQFGGMECGKYLHVPSALYVTEGVE